MSLRRRETTSSSPPSLQQNFNRDVGFITDTGFGVCTNGAIGFADDVIGTTTSMNYPSEITTTVSSNQKNKESTSIIMSNRDAQDHMMMAWKNNSPPTTYCTCSDGGLINYGNYKNNTPTTYCTCPDGGLISSRNSMNKAPTTSSYCTCPDGGLISSRNSMTSSEYYDEDYDSSQTNKFKRLQSEYSEDHQTKMNRKIMNKMVFEAVTGIPYSKTSAQDHSVVDIFKTFPDGIPTHDDMTLGEAREAEMMSSMMDSARWGIQNAVQTGTLQIRPGDKLARDLKKIQRYLHKFAADDKDSAKYLKILEVALGKLDKETAKAFNNSYRLEGEDNLVWKNRMIRLARKIFNGLNPNREVYEASLGVRGLGIYDKHTEIYYKQRIKLAELEIIRRFESFKFKARKDGLESDDLEGYRSSSAGKKVYVLLPGEAPREEYMKEMEGKGPGVYLIATTTPFVDVKKTIRDQIKLLKTLYNPDYKKPVNQGKKKKTNQGEAVHHIHPEETHHVVEHVKKQHPLVKPASGYRSALIRNMGG